MNDRDKTITELLDKALADIAGQQLVSSTEMTDMLLDIRLFLMASDGQKADK